MNNKHKIWVIDDDRSIRWVLQKALQKEGFEAVCFSSATEVLEELEKKIPDVVISDVRMPGMDGISLLNQIHEVHPTLPVIIITAHSDLENAVAAYHGGAFEYLPKPFDIDAVIELTHRACRQKEQITATGEIAPEEVPDIIGESPAMQEVFCAIGRLARSSITVLINGESGTGKELVAHALHRHSPRADKPFIALNMAAVPADLIESELFGHERGAFTGAQNRRHGRFEQADGGTLFLDEIGDMPALLQSRLLRVLADGEFYRVGGHEPVKVDVRIIAATNQNLEQQVADGQFRGDLFHRLNVIRIHIPALRERREDITLLMHHFLAHTANELEVEQKRLLPETEAILSRFDWPGNVRQLENTARWLTVMVTGRTIHPEDLPSDLIQQDSEYAEKTSGDWLAGLQKWVHEELHRGQENLLEIALTQFERVLIEAALKKTNGKRQEAARLLGWGRNTLTRKISGLKEKGIAIQD